MSLEGIEEVALTRLKFAGQTWIDRLLLEESALGLDRIVKMEAERLTMTVVSNVLAEHLGAEAVSFPADWWQGVKARWFPAWALKRWPVQRRTIKLDAYELHPRLRVADGDRHPRVIVSDSFAEGLSNVH